MSPPDIDMVSGHSDDMESSHDETRTATTAETTDRAVQQQDGSSSLLRSGLGQTMNKISEHVNENLVAFRYGAVASTILLTAYGLANTPLFFRYRTVAGIPSSFFIGRRRLYCRIIGVDHRSSTSSGAPDTSIHLLVRNLSPIGLLLPTPWFEFLMRMSPSSRFAKGTSRQAKPEEDKNELLRIQIAGVQTPPVSRLLYNPDTFLERLAKERTLVSCHLLARAVPILKTGGDKLITPAPTKQQNWPSQVPSGEIKGRKIDEVPLALDPKANDGQQVAICRLTYRPKIWQLFSTDIAETLVRSGNASVSSTMLGTHDAVPMRIVDSSQRLQDLRADVKYLDRLAQTEFVAAKASAGMWSVPDVRKMKREVVEEVDFQTKANIFQKLWRWLRNS